MSPIEWGHPALPVPTPRDFPQAFDDWSTASHYELSAFVSRLRSSQGSSLDCQSTQCTRSLLLAMPVVLAKEPFAEQVRIRRVGTSCASAASSGQVSDWNGLALD